MAEPKIPIEPEKYYHIYNRGIDRCRIFIIPDNYSYFMRLYSKHIQPIAELFTWVLMGNHFHFLIRIKEKEELVHLQGFENLEGVAMLNHINQQFSNWFNAYSKAFNKQNDRSGSLFQHGFRRKSVDTEYYLRELVMYIHTNPVHHNFCQHPNEYHWSSYNSCLSDRPTKLKRETVMEWFDDKENFIHAHDNYSMNETLTSHLQGY